MAKSEMTGHSFLALIQKWHNLFFENFSCKLLSFKLHELILDMAGVLPPLNFNCVWFVDPTFPESKSKALLKLCIKLSTLA